LPPILLGGQAFRSIAAVKRHLQPLIMAAPLDTDIVDPVLLDLARTRHYGIARAAVTPTAVVKSTRFPTDYSTWSLAVRLAERPGITRFSYQKCLEEWSFRKEFDRALRHRFRTRVRQHHLVAACEACGARGQLDLDHVSPSFATISSFCWSALTEREQEDWMGYDWFIDTDFRVPEDHPATVIFDRLHATATFATLCPPCHRAATSARRVAS
jgi:hypothetical protein